MHRESEEGGGSKEKENGGGRAGRRGRGGVGGGGTSKLGVVCFCCSVVYGFWGFVTGGK